MESTSELAARWVVRADAGPLSPIEERELEAWLAADPRHRGAFVRARAQWVNLDRMAAMRGPGSHFIEPPAHTQVENETESLLSRRQLLAAGIAAAAVMGGGMSWLLMGERRERYISGIGEVRRIPLGDGSTVLLNTDTELVVQLTKNQRNVQLVRGEALFEVAHDRMRPFIVSVNDTAVRAVGTAFAVRLEATHVDVTVTEGVVEVSDRTAVAVTGPVIPAVHAGTQRVRANERVVVARAQIPEIESIAVAEANRQLAWREGMVSFDGESLQTAADEINRHNHRQIVIADPVLAGRPVVGVFRTNDLDGFSVAAAAALKAHVVADDDVIRLEPGTL